MSLCHPHGKLTFTGLQTGRSRPVGGGSFSTASLPTDQIGAFTLKLKNVSVGARVHVERSSDGFQFSDSLAAVSSPIIELSAYASGNPSNELRVKIRDASGSPAYKPWETQTTAIVGGTEIYVSQILDE